MTDEQKQSGIQTLINGGGIPGESIFWRFVPEITPNEAETYVNLLQQWQDEYRRHYEELKDDRAIVVVEALCIEDCLDKMIEAIFPRSKEILENKDFSFSLKIDLIRAYNVIPNRILDDCDTIRQMRNDFAHELSLKTFSDWDIYISKKKKAGSKRQTFKDVINRAIKVYGNYYDLRASYRVRFEDFAAPVIMSLLLYVTHVQAMRKFMDSEDFMKTLIEFSQRK